MNIVLVSCLCSLLGSIFGGLIGAICKKQITFCLAFAGGVMIGVVFIDIFPRLMERPFLSILSISIGFFLVALLNELLDDSHINKSWVIVFIAMSLHNLPEGLVVGASTNINITLSITIILLMILHDIPEGMSIGCLYNEKRKYLFPILLSVISSLFTFLGAFWGLWIGQVSMKWLIFLLGVASGAMLYVSFGELLPLANSYQKEGKKNKTVLYIMIGILVTIFVTKLIGG